MEEVRPETIHPLPYSDSGMLGRKRAFLGDLVKIRFCMLLEKASRKEVGNDDQWSFSSLTLSVLHGL